MTSGLIDFIATVFAFVVVAGAAVTVVASATFLIEAFIEHRRNREN